MNNIQRQEINFITDLIKKTSNNLLQWQQIIPPEYLVTGTNFIVPVCYQTNYDSFNSFILYEIRYKNYIDEDNFYWANEIRISKMEKTGVISWTNSNQLSNLNDLFSVVLSSTSGMNQFLNQF